VSGMGLASLYRFVTETGRAKGGLGTPEGGGIAEAYDHDDAARVVIDRFVSLYGAAAGDLALEVVPTGGLYVAGGIAPKLHAQLGAAFVERFVEAFLDKAPMGAVVARTRVTLVNEPAVGLLGAARAAG
ncbi:MAG: glucokinase, partial [Myxococcales bacterium]|nr:glucokinase [Myxococcales bacterium]